MDRPVVSSPLELDILSAIADAPRVYQKSNVRAVPKFRPRGAGSEMTLDDANVRRWKFGPKAEDVTLECSKLNEATALALEEIEDRSIRVHCYPAFPASVSAIVPLLRGVKGDPNDGTYTGSAGTGCTVYLRRSDPAHPVWYELVDPSKAIIAREIRTGDGTSKRFPFGTGVFFPGAMTNKISNSLLGILTGYDPDDWTQTGGTWGTDCGVVPAAESFCGLPCLYVWGTSILIQSHWVPVAPGSMLNCAFAYRHDGTLDAFIDYDSGTSNTIDTTAPSGWAYSPGNIVPAGATTARLTLQLSAGTYFEAGGFSLTYHSAVDWPKVPLLVASSVAGDATLNACYADFKVNAETGIFPSTPIAFIAGLFQPAFGVENVDPTQVLAALWTDRASDHSMDIAMADYGTGMKFHVRQNGTVKASSATISPAHVLGDTYAWIVWGGWTGTNLTAYKVGCKAIKVGETAACASCETGTSVATYQVWDRLRIGAGLAASENADGILGNVVCGTLDYPDIDKVLGLLANRDMLDLWRRMAGRLYNVDNNLNQLSPQRGYWFGSVQLTQAELL